MGGGESFDIDEWIDRKKREIITSKSYFPIFQGEERARKESDYILGSG